MADLRGMVRLSEFTESSRVLIFHEKIWVNVSLLLLLLPNVEVSHGSGPPIRITGTSFGWATFSRPLPELVWAVLSLSAEVSSAEVSHCPKIWVKSDHLASTASVWKYCDYDFQRSLSLSSLSHRHKTLNILGGEIQLFAKNCWWYWLADQSHWQSSTVDKIGKRIDRSYRGWSGLVGVLPSHSQLLEIGVVLVFLESSAWDFPPG